MSLLEKRKLSVTKAEFWSFEQRYLLMWTLSSIVETVHHKRAQCGEKQAKIFPRTVPLLLRSHSPSATVFTPISPATVISETFPTDTGSSRLYSLN